MINLIARLILLSGFIVIPLLVFLLLTAATPVIWYDASRMTSADALPVVEWTDFSGSGNTAAGSTGTARPTFKTSIQNSLTIVRFDGSNDFLSFANFAMPAQPNTVIIVGKQSSKVTSARFFDSGNGVTGRQILGLNTSGFVDLFAGTLKNDAVDHSGAFHIITGVFNGTTSFAYVDGATVISSQNSGTQGAAASNFLGKDNSGVFLNGDFAEFKVFASALSDADRQNEEAALAIKWGIANPTATPTATATSTPTATPSATVNCPVVCPTPTVTPTNTPTPTVTPTPCGGVSRARVSNPE